MDIPTKLRPFDFHGVDLDYSNTRHGNEAVGTCPICEKEDHLYVNKDTGQYSCKSCGEEGNGITFLRRLHEVALENTSQEDYRILAEDRGLPVKTLKEWGLATNPINGDWLVPCYNAGGKLANVSIRVTSRYSSVSANASRPTADNKVRDSSGSKSGRRKPRRRRAPSGWGFRVRNRVEIRFKPSNSLLRNMFKTS